MAKVMVTFRVLPKDIEVNLDRLEMEIKEKVKPDRVAREPLAFGLSALLVTKLVADAAGEVEKVENQIKEIKGSGQIDVVEVSRVL